MSTERMQQLAGITLNEAVVDPALNVAEELLDWARRFSHGTNGGQKAPMGKIKKIANWHNSKATAYEVKFPFMTKKMSIENGMYELVTLEVEHFFYDAGGPVEKDQNSIAISYVDEKNAKGQIIQFDYEENDSNWGTRKAFAKILTFLDRELNKRAY